jgi:hypothetical protein
MLRVEDRLFSGRLKESTVKIDKRRRKNRSKRKGKAETD